jgi:hypothetical protein
MLYEKKYPPCLYCYWSTAVVLLKMEESLGFGDETSHDILFSPGALTLDARVHLRYQAWLALQSRSRQFRPGPYARAQLHDS